MSSGIVIRVRGSLVALEKCLPTRSICTAAALSMISSTRKKRCKLGTNSDADKVAAIMAARAAGTGIRRIARELGVGVGTVLRVTGDDA